jgi:hypothetical protein
MERLLISKWTLNVIALYPVKREVSGDLIQTKERRHCDQRGRDGVIKPQPKECQKLEEARERFSPRTLVESSIYCFDSMKLTSDSGLLNSKRINFYCVKLPNLWQP